MSQLEDQSRTLKAQLDYLARYLDRHEAQVIILKVMGRALNDSLFILQSSDLLLDGRQVQRMEDYKNKRLNDQLPLAYLLGEHNFFGYALKTDHRALIPRPETELLVEEALKLISASQMPCLLDLGTGSGAIALAMAQERPDARVFASDLSFQALKLAQENHQGLSIQPIQSHWLQGFKPNQFDLILSNPPYIDSQEWSMMNPETAFEPYEALFAADAGLGAYKQLVPASFESLKAGGWLGVEHGFQQGAAIQHLFKLAGFEQISSLKDYAGLDRMIFGQKQP